MSYRFLKLATLYPDFWRGFAARWGQCSGQGYQVLMDALCSEPFGWSDYFAQEFAKLGVRAAEVFANAEPLQAAWAREHGLPESGDGWLKRVLVRQVAQFRPDVLFFEDSGLLEHLPEILAACATPPRVLAGWQYTPLRDPSPLRSLDLLLTGSENHVQEYRRAGLDATVLPLAFSPNCLNHAAPQGPDLDFTFSGSLGAQLASHQGRYALIETLMRDTPLQLWSKDTANNFTPLKARAISLAYGADAWLRRQRISRALRSRLPFIGRAADWAYNPAAPSLATRYPGRVHTPVFGADYFTLLSRSRLALNVHIDGMAPYAGNMRLFEATGMGACLVTEAAVNLRDMFEPDSEVVIYSSREECVEKVRYLLDHEGERSAIAQAGHARTLRTHTYAQRVQVLHDLLLRRLGQ